jgi:hypothetical protein
MSLNTKTNTHLLPSILSSHTSHPLIVMFRSCAKHCLTLLTFLLCIRCKLYLSIYLNRTLCICGHHDHDIYGVHAFCCERGSKKWAHNIIALDFAGALSPVLAQAGYLYPNTSMAVKPLFHLHSDPMAQPFDVSFSPDPTSCHCCPYTTIGVDINITGPATYTQDLPT